MFDDGALHQLSLIRQAAAATLSLPRKGGAGSNRPSAAPMREIRQRVEVARV
jgi:hypothetical protein